MVEAWGSRSTLFQHRLTPHDTVLPCFALHPVPSSIQSCAQHAALGFGKATLRHLPRIMSFNLSDDFPLRTTAAVSVRLSTLRGPTHQIREVRLT